ncbi:Stk1 family PASTA domain-containing Ser/Thr kinase [Amycolatopsis endophytica]|uniref:non-specific serine/threonine protein kinase n=1 Tax=Amycolatopsis endophytica TaxID=860233 RepID=A0A853B6J9_9PSEU|nr:Stk1 family PASTA domain-containing Ser/Thr kinase [Amycolatopsis endophytica]NYI90361.1 serine/threonine-protein kinase [Amycolatopsis endophytica]
MTSTETSLAGALLERRYRVDGLLARGGMSAVYRGSDTRLDRPVAIKIMDPRFADDRSFVDRFEREARLAAKLHHPNVVTVHDQGVDVAGDRSHVFLVMELVDGGTLRDLLEQRGKLDVPLALSVAEQMLSALSAAHQAGLVHRDVKPENVLIGHTGHPPAGVVKVADFGLVRAVASAGTTSSSIILGTVSYLAPEQVTTGAADEPGDVYSAGIVFYEMLTGKVPYTGDTAISVAYRHVNDDVPAPSTVEPGIPAVLDDLVLRATRRDPEARPADAGAFLQELRRVRAALGIAPAPIPVLPAKQLPAPPVAPPPADPEKTVPAFSPVAATGPVTGPRGTQALMRPHSAPPPPQAPPGQEPPTMVRRRPVVLWTVIAVLIAAVLGTGVWWFTVGQDAAQAVAVPTLTGMDQATAEKTLHDAGLASTIVRERHNSVPAGQVIGTDPIAGASAEKGSTVTVTLSSGRPTVPDISQGTGLEQAETAIRDAGLTPQRDASADAYSASVPEGKVLSVNPQPGTQLPIGSAVKIALSKGAPPTPVPSVAGLSRDDAFQRLKSAGFEPYDAGTEFSDDVPSGSVTRTTPAAGSTIEGQSDLRVGVYTNNAVDVPTVVGRPVQDAIQLLSDAGLQADVEGKTRNFSIVIGQDPEPGERVERGKKVKLEIFP